MKKNLYHSKKIKDNKLAQSLILTPENAGWKYLGFEVCNIPIGQLWSTNTGIFEVAIVFLGGVADISSNVGCWDEVGDRDNIFSGLPHTLYLPPGTYFDIKAKTNVEVALCKARTDELFPARVIYPQDVKVEIRGQGSFTRQVSNIILSDFSASRILIVEVYTPGGNWSGYPPHKHDNNDFPREVALEEYYYYRFKRPEGYALQRIYSKNRRNDKTYRARDEDLILVREGYHQVAAPPGYDVYYLNALAGDIRSLVPQDDPDFTWIKSLSGEKDRRLPMVHI